MATVGDFLGRVLINNMSSCVSGLRASGACQYMYTVCMYYCLSMFLSPLLSLFFPFLPPSSMSLPPMNVIVFLLFHFQSHLFPPHIAIFSLPLSSLSSSHYYFLPTSILLSPSISLSLLPRGTTASDNGGHVVSITAPDLTSLSSISSIAETVGFAQVAASLANQALEPNQISALIPLNSNAAMASSVTPSNSGINSGVTPSDSGINVGVTPSDPGIAVSNESPVVSSTTSVSNSMQANVTESRSVEDVVSTSSV